MVSDEIQNSNTEVNHEDVSMSRVKNQVHRQDRIVACFHVPKYPNRNVNVAEAVKYHFSEKQLGNYDSELNSSFSLMDSIFQIFDAIFDENHFFVDLACILDHVQCNNQ